MSRTQQRRLGLIFALLTMGAPVAVSFAQPQSGFKTEYFHGKVVPLAALVEKQGAKLDPDAAAHWMALVGDDGKIYPLIKDDAARMFFKDKRLLGRPMRLTGRLLPQSQLLQVVNVHSYLKGQLHEVYYWCDTCSIRSYELGDCACCGAPIVLREDLLK